MAYLTGHYCSITLSSGLSSGSLTNYTAWITAESVSSAVLSSIQTNARSDLNDVRFSTDTAGDNLVSFYKIHALPGSSQWAFLVGPINYTASTSFTLYMHWGDSSLTTDVSSSACFSSDVIGAWSPRDSGNLSDLSGNGHTLTATGTVDTSDNSHPSGAYSYTPGTTDAYLSASGQDFGQICNSQSCSIEMLSSHTNSNAGHFCAVSNSATSAYFSSYYATSGARYYFLTRPGGGLQTSTQITSGQSSAWTYTGMVYDQASTSISGRWFGTSLSSTSVSAINTAMTEIGILNNVGNSNPVIAAVALVILRNVAVSAEWMLAGERLSGSQSTYVTYSTSVENHGYDPLVTESGTFASTGSPVGLIVSRLLPADFGSFIVVGTATGLSKAYIVLADNGSFTTTGNNNNLVVSRLLNIDTGLHITTGNNTNLLASRLLTIDFGTYNLTGNDISLSKAFLLLLDSGIHTLVGNNTNLLASRVLSIDYNTYTLTGNDLIFSLPNVYLLSPDSGTLNLVENSINLVTSRLLSTNTGSYVLTGYDFDILSAIHVIASEGVKYVYILPSYRDVYILKNKRILNIK